MFASDLILPCIPRTIGRVVGGLLKMRHYSIFILATWWYMAALSMSRCLDNNSFSLGESFFFFLFSVASVLLQPFMLGFFLANWGVLLTGKRVSLILLPSNGEVYLWPLLYIIQWKIHLAREFSSIFRAQGTSFVESTEEPSFFPFVILRTSFLPHNGTDLFLSPLKLAIS